MKFTQEVQKATDPIYQKISKVMSEIEWSVLTSFRHPRCAGRGNPAEEGASVQSLFRWRLPRRASRGRSHR